MRYRISATQKATGAFGYRYITHVQLASTPSGFNTTIFTKEAAVYQVAIGNWQLYTYNYFTGGQTDVVIRHREGHPFLMTEADNTTSDNLLNLPDIWT